MFFPQTLNRVWATAMPVLSILMLISFTSTLAATANFANASFEGPVVRSIPPQSIHALTRYNFVVNGAFVGTDLHYSATLADGSELPYWMKLSETDGSFSMFAPSSSLGQIHQVKVTARDASGTSATTTFYLNVTDSSPDCRVNANSDRLGKILTCAGDTVKLRGEIHNDLYHWMGPNGFESDEKEPVVTVPGHYILTTSEEGPYRCPTAAIVEVVKLNDCDPDPVRNKLPNVLIKSDWTTGPGPLTVHFDATNTLDMDGSVLRYVWSWEGGSATGMKPTVTFSEGEYEVILTVTDDHGARATDRVTINALPPPAHTTYWLEAECADVGKNWVIVTSTRASGGDYATPLHSSSSSVPEDVPSNQVRFVLPDAQKGTFQLYARVDALGMLNDSYYVRVNGGAWYAWKSGMIKGQGFQWNQLPQQVELETGTNVIDFAYREASTRLDKLFLTTKGGVPTGLGEKATNCATPNVAPLAVATTDMITGVAPLAVALDGSASYDMDGKLTSYRWNWTGGTAEGTDTEITLPAGTHLITLTVTDNEGAEDQDEVLVIVETPSTDPDPDPMPEPAPDPTPTMPDTDPGSDEFWLEAECAIVGSNWSEKPSSSASGSTYVVVPTGSAMSTPPADLAANQVRFTLSASTAGEYFLFARVNSPNNDMDSYWVRVNNGSWYKWNSGVRRGVGFNWTKLPIALNLTNGHNTVDFAFRESGTQLDKIYVSLHDVIPTGTGTEATNCGTTETVAETALEAECALDNSGWITEYSADADGGTYMVFAGSRRLAAPTDTDPGNFLTYEVETKQSGLHTLFLRLDAPDPGRNSIWVQLDYGEWVLFWKGSDGNQFITKGFEWLEVTNDGQAISFDLSKGYHTIRLANRESGTKVDKLFLTTDTTLPTGFGPESAGCDDGSQSVGMQMMFSSTTPTEEEAATEVITPTASIFPNPTVDRLTLELSSNHTGAVDLIIYDMNGRRIRQEQFLKDDTQSSTELSVGSLPSGVYHLRVIEGDRATTQSFVVGR